MKKQNKETDHKLKCQSLLLGRVKGCSAPPVSGPDYSVSPSTHDSLFSVDQASGQMLPPPGGLP